MKEKWLLLSLIGFLISCSKQESMDALTARVFTVAEQQYLTMDTRLEVTTLPQSIASDSTFKSSTIYWWCSGFYPGSLWYIYEYTQNEAVKTLAEKNTLKLDPIQYVTNDHDVGFQLNCSYGNGFRLTGNDTLEYVARTHANTTLKNHFRKDYSAYHLVDYDPEDGHVRSRQTVQGYSNESSWGRGQAWALYGYTMMFRMTRDEKYLEHAENIADMLLSRLPVDGIPYWDFDAPNGNEYRDASAGAIMASAFVELSGFATDEKARQNYLSIAEKQLRTLASSHYLAEPGTNCNFILKHSVGNLPEKSEVDVPLSYADYYFLEALLRYKKAMG